MQDHDQNLISQDHNALIALLFLIVAPFIHPRVHYTILILICWVLLRISYYDSENSRKKESVSTSKKGLAHAAIAAPFLIIAGIVALFGIEFGMACLDNMMGKKNVITLIYGGLLLSCAIDIFILIRKDRKQPYPNISLNPEGHGISAADS